MIASSKWDYVVLQEQSTLPLKNPARMHEYVRLFDGEIRRRRARTVLYMTWARRHELQRQEQLAKAYTDVGREIGAIVVPVGLAWQRVFLRHPEIVLHDKDNSHPNLAGSYLSACVFFAALFGTRPAEGEAAHVPEAERIGADVARVLGEVAWEITV